MIPPRTPFCLIQEDLWPDQWKILVACIMLNCTSRKQVDSVLPEFFKRWPTPQTLLKADKNDVANLIRCLGFVNRRTSILFKMSEQFLTQAWTHVSELPGIGEYGWRSWEIFCLGHLGDTAPNDHALVKAWKWLKERNGNEKALHREEKEGT